MNTRQRAKRNEENITDLTNGVRVLGKKVMQLESANHTTGTMTISSSRPNPIVRPGIQRGKTADQKAADRMDFWITLTLGAFAGAILLAGWTGMLV